MIAKKHLYWTHLNYSIITKLGLLPFSYDGKTATASVCSRRWRYWAWLVLYGMNSVKTGFAVERLIDWAQNPDAHPLKYLPLHFMFTSINVCIVYWAYEMFISKPGIHVAVFNSLENNDAGIDEDNLSWKDYTLQEVAALSLAAVIPIFAISYYLLMHILFPDAPLFIYSVVPTSAKSTPMLCMFIGLEGVLMLFAVSIGPHTCYCLPISFQKYIEFCDARLKVIRESRLSPKSVMTEYMNLRRVQLELNLFNILFSGIVFAMKQFILTSSIVELFLAIKLMEESADVASVMLVLGCYHVFMYIGFFDRAFCIPDKIAEVVHELEVAGAKLKNEQKRTYLKKLLRSVPQTGIKVGGFMLMERESTLNFIDFVVANVIDLLVSFK